MNPAFFPPWAWRETVRKAVALLATLVVAASCSSDSGSPFVPPGTKTDTHLIRDVDTMRDTYFYVNNPAVAPGPDLIPDPATLEVYRTVKPADLIADPTIVALPGWAFPDPGDSGAGIEAGASQVVAAPDALYQLLNPAMDYALVLDPVTKVFLGIELSDPIPDSAQRELAIRYETSTGIPIGGNAADYNLTSISGVNAFDLVLKLIKTRWPMDTEPTWPYAMRNVYDLGFTGIDARYFSLSIEDVLAPRKEPWKPSGSEVPYLRIFGLDQTDVSGIGPPDGNVDLTNGIVDLDRGRLMFPEARAFAPPAARVAAWTDGLFEFTGGYQAQYDQATRIYDEWLNPTQEAEVHQYLIRVSITRPVTP